MATQLTGTHTRALGIVITATEARAGQLLRPTKFRFADEGCGRIKIRYITVGKARPPHFAVFGNQLDALPKSYARYLVNGLREAFDLPGVPIRMSLRMGKNPYDKEKR